MFNDDADFGIERRLYDDEDYQPLCQICNKLPQAVSNCSLCGNCKYCGSDKRKINKTRSCGKNGYCKECNDEEGYHIHPQPVRNR